MITWTSDIDGWKDIVLPLWTSLATFASIVFAYKASRAEQKIAIAPKRTQLFMLFGLISDALKSATNAKGDGKLQVIADKWMDNITNDARFSMLKEFLGVSEYKQGATARWAFQTLVPHLKLALYQIRFSFANKSVENASEEISSLLDCLSKVSSGVLEEGETDNVAEVWKIIQIVLDDSAKGKKAMEKALAYH